MLPEKKQVVDAVFDEDEVPLLATVGIGRVVGLEEPDLARVAGLARSRSSVTKQKRLKSTQFADLAPDNGWSTSNRCRRMPDSRCARFEPINPAAPVIAIIPGPSLLARLSRS
jgi:hypothetical protein